MNYVITPRFSEKSFGQSKDSVYTFDVPMNANKLTIKDMVEKQFDVKVVAVNISLTKGKVKRTVRKRGQQNKGKRSDYKKAYVTVAEGQTIPVFASAQEEGEE